MLGRRWLSICSCGAPKSTGRTETGCWWSLARDAGELTARWICKKPTSPSNARVTLKVVRKTICTIVLLTITVVRGAIGTSDDICILTLLRAKEEKAMYQSDVYSIILWGRKKSRGMEPLLLKFKLLQIAEGSFWWKTNNLKIKTFPAATVGCQPIRCWTWAFQWFYEN